MRNKIFAFFIIILLILKSVFAQTNNPQKLYVSMIGLSPQVTSYLVNNKVDNLLILDNRYIDPEKRNQLNIETLTNAINKLIPSHSARGIVVLDYEGQMYNDLCWWLKPGNPVYDKDLQVYIDVIKLCKSLRPNIKWGFWGFPFTSRQKPDDRWIQSNVNITPLLKNCDIFFPNMYLSGYEPNGNKIFAAVNMNDFLLLAKNLKKELLPFVWNRYYPKQVTNFRLKNIPTDEFINYVNYILVATNAKKRAVGVVLWGADDFFYYQEKEKQLLSEASPSNFPAYRDSNLEKYMGAMMKVIDKSK